jgi:hypothetical protein
MLWISSAGAPEAMIIRSDMDANGTSPAQIHSSGDNPSPNPHAGSASRTRLG